MRRKVTYIVFVIIAIFSVGFFSQSKSSQIADDRFIVYVANPQTQKITFFWKNEKGENLKNAENLNIWLKTNNKKLLFSTNGGMYKKDRSPQGLYIEYKIIKTKIDTSSGNGNFYLKPNGIFYITTDNNAVISQTEDFINKGNIKYATQSGPMLVIDGTVHSAFKEKSTNLNIRNGVGILPNNEVVFVISKKEINFYEFADFFKKLGCKNALYLDGFVSRTYLPEKNWEQLDGDFGVIIGVTE